MQVFDPQILIVEDNSDDVLILEHALERAEIAARELGITLGPATL